MPDNTNKKLLGCYLQDPAVGLAKDVAFDLDADFLDGVGSSKLCIRDTDADGFQLFDEFDWGAAGDLTFKSFAGMGLEPVDNPQFHQVNLFAVAHLTLQWIEAEMGHGIDWSGGGPLTLRPHAFEGPNAYYDPATNSLNFGYFTSPFSRTPIWTALSHDIIAHELGHAVLDNLRPLFLYSAEIDTGALHESFGDLVAMFSALQHREVVEHFFPNGSAQQLRDSNLISQLAEEFGVGLSGESFPYLRSALDVYYYDQYEPAQPHERSKIWTSASYEILVRFCELAMEQGQSFTDALCSAARWLRGMTWRALLYMPPTAITMPTLARLVVLADEQVFPETEHSALREIATAVFHEWGLWDDAIDFTAPEIGKDVLGVDPSDVAGLARVVMQYAEELDIPRDVNVRLMTPRLVPSHRSVDSAVATDGTREGRAIDQWFLHYAWEITVLDFCGQPVNVYGGGTLAINEDGAALALVTDPPRVPVEGEVADSVTRGLDRYRRVRRRMRLQIEAAQSPAAGGGAAGSPTLWGVGPTAGLGPSWGGGPTRGVGPTWGAAPTKAPHEATSGGQSVLARLGRPAPVAWPYDDVRASVGPGRLERRRCGLDARLGRSVGATMPVVLHRRRR